MDEIAKKLYFLRKNTSRKSFIIRFCGRHKLERRAEIIRGHKNAAKVSPMTVFSPRYFVTWDYSRKRGTTQRSVEDFRITERGSPASEWPRGERHSALTCFSICTELHEVNYIRKKLGKICTYRIFCQKSAIYMCKKVYTQNVRYGYGNA